jgi:hypothetical protein
MKARIEMKFMKAWINERNERNENYENYESPDK